MKSLFTRLHGSSPRYLRDGELRSFAVLASLSFAIWLVATAAMQTPL